MKFPVPQLLERSVFVITLSDFGSLAAVDPLFVSHDEALPSPHAQIESTRSAPNNDADLLDSYSKAVVNAAERVSPSVLQIITHKRINSKSSALKPAGTGSGFLISADGLALTKQSRGAWCG